MKVLERNCDDRLFTLTGLAAGTETRRGLLVHGDLLQANLLRKSRIRQRLVPQ